MATEALVALFCALAGGCSGPVGQYFELRKKDLGDCFKIGLGGGVPVYARVKATDFAVAGGGFAYALRDTWPDRKDTRPAGDLLTTLHEFLVPEFGVPLLVNCEKSGGRWTVTLGPCVTSQVHRPFEPKLHTRVADRFWFGAKATLLLSVELGVNPVEFADFLVGWFGWNLLQDDVTVGEILVAANADDVARVRELLAIDPTPVEARDFRGQMLFHWAAWRNKQEVVAALLDSGTDLAARDNRGETPLHFVLRKGRPGTKEIVKLLLAHGADVNATDKHGEAPLALAARKHREAVAKLLRLAGGK